ncbi:MAG: ribosomal protein S18-alanine N-acetyltransferase [Thermodesulfobacteriota bacterium]
MKASDLDAVVKIERRAFSAPWHRSAFVNGLRTPFARNYIVEYGKDLSSVLKNRHMVGYVCFQLVADEIHLLKIAVEPDWRRQGIAKFLLGRCLETAGQEGFCSVILEVRRSNIGAIAFYRKFDFDVIGIRPNYYVQDSGPTEDAMLMRKKLKRR